MGDAFYYSKFKELIGVQFLQRGEACEWVKIVAAGKAHLPQVGEGLLNCLSILPGCGLRDGRPLRDRFADQAQAGP